MEGLGGRRGWWLKKVRLGADIDIQLRRQGNIRGDSDRGMSCGGHLASGMCVGACHLRSLLRAANEVGLFLVAMAF